MYNILYKSLAFGIAARTNANLHALITLYDMSGWCTSACCVLKCLWKSANEFVVWKPYRTWNLFIRSLARYAFINQKKERRESISFEFLLTLFQINWERDRQINKELSFITNNFPLSFFHIWLPFIPCFKCTWWLQHLTFFYYLYPECTPHPLYIYIFYLLFFTYLLNTSKQQQQQQQQFHILVGETALLNRNSNLSNK